MADCADRHFWVEVRQIHLCCVHPFSGLAQVNATEIQQNFAMQADDARGGREIDSFVILAKHAKGKAAIDLIGKAIETPRLFFFGELLDCPTIIEVRRSKCCSVRIQGSTRGHHASST